MLLGRLDCVDLHNNVIDTEQVMFPQLARDPYLFLSDNQAAPP